MLAQEQGARTDQPSVLTCPDCGGVLWEMSNGNLIEYRCHVGHVFGIDSLMELQADAIEGALWTAIRSLRERVVLTQRLATRATQQNRNLAAQQFAREAQQAAEAAAVLRQLAENGKNGVTDPLSGDGEETV
jgi:two-component system chemotaxis response regulator CheB